MEFLTLASCHAPALDLTVQALAEYIAVRLACRVEVIDTIEWEERYRRLDTGEIDLAWICGAPYVRRMATIKPPIELLAAPVWRGERYQDQPIYFSDVVVQRNSGFCNFADLRASIWVYNEVGSLSGYAIMQAHLAEHAEMENFFAATVQSGAHRQSIQMILAGQADVAAIDSVVLEQLLHIQPEIAQQLRTVAILGPNPSMPWVVGTHMPQAVRHQLRQLLITMHEDATGQAVLAQTPVTRFATVTDQAYDPIRTLLRKSATRDM
jgi:phosphonate transport system substrate-binding protein